MAGSRPWRCSRRAVDRRSEPPVCSATAPYAARGDERLATERAIYDRLCAALAEALPAGTRERLMAEGAAWTEDQAVDEALTV